MIKLLNYGGYGDEIGQNALDIEMQFTKEHYEFGQKLLEMLQGSTIKIKESQKPEAEKFYYTVFDYLKDCFSKSQLPQEKITFCEYVYADIYQKLKHFAPRAGGFKNMLNSIIDEDSEITEKIFSDIFEDKLKAFTAYHDEIVSTIQDYVIEQGEDDVGGVVIDRDSFDLIINSPIDFYFDNAYKICVEKLINKFYHSKKNV